MIFQSLWKGERLSPLEELSIKSFIDHGLAYHLYVYDDVKNVPDGCVLKDAREIFPESEVFAYSKPPHTGSFSAFSNLFRYKLLLERGGWWVDTDIINLTADWPDAPRQIGLYDDGVVNGAVIRAPAGDSLMRDCLAKAAAFNKDFAWGQAGPHLMTATLFGGVYDYVIQPKKNFYPVHFNYYADPLIPGQIDETFMQRQGAVCLHLWNEMYRQNGIDKNICPPQGSWLYQLYARHDLLSRFQDEYAYDCQQRRFTAVPFGAGNYADAKAAIAAQRQDYEHSFSAGVPVSYDPPLQALDIAQPLSALANYFKCGKGPLAKNVADFYELYLKPLRTKQDMVVGEIGVASGASLKTWMVYFPAGQIIGMDYRDSCRHMADQYPNIRIEIADARETAISQPVDLLIDDASGVPADSVAIFRRQWPQVKPGGFYVIENLRVGYDPARRQEILRFYQATPEEMDRAQLLELFDELLQGVQLGQGGFIHIYPDICFIRKGQN